VEFLRGTDLEWEDVRIEGVVDASQQGRLEKEESRNVSRNVRVII